MNLSAVGTDNGECSSQWLSWEVNVDLFDDWSIDHCFSSRVSPVLATGEPNPKYLGKTGSGDAVTISIPDGVAGSKSQHRIEWNVSDGCGNQSSVTSYFTIEDKKAPTPFCLDVGTAVMSDGTVEIWAIDFENKSFDNCTADDELLFTFTDVPPPPRCDDEYDSNTQRMWYNGTFWYFDSSEIEEDEQECGVTGAGEYMNIEDYGGDIHIWQPALRSSGKVFTRDDITPTGFVTVPIYVWDGCANVDFCSVEVRLIDNGGGVSVSGIVATENRDRVSGATAELMTDDPRFPLQVITDAEGRYMFDDAPMSQDYSVSGSKDGDDANGVSTLDLLIIQRHILGISPLESPYKQIAADVNGDNKINGVDLVELRKLVLGIYTEFPQSDSWRLVDAGQVLDVENPWNYQTTRTISDLGGDMMAEDFIGVKVGDVNDDVELLTTTTPEVSRQVNLELSGESVSDDVVAVTLKSEEALGGYQFTLELGSLELLEVEGISEDKWALHGDQLTVSADLDGERSGELLTLRVKGEEASAVTSELAVSSAITRAEAYVGSDLDVAVIRLTGAEAAFSLGQNEPNPFNSQTVISYVLPEASAVTLTLTDVTGKILNVLEAEGVQGRNEITVDRSGLEAGMIYYRLEAGKYSQTRHMIVIE